MFVRTTKISHGGIMKNETSVIMSKTATSRTIMAVGMTLSLLFAVHASAPWARGSANGEPDKVSRYLIIDTVRTSTMQKELSEAAATGYRVLTGDGGYHILVLEKDAAGKKHEYLFTDSLLRDLEKGEVKGYRILAGTFGARDFRVGAVLEKLAEGETKSDYHILDTTRTSSFEKDMNEWAGKGFRLVALAGDERNYGLMERREGAPTSGPIDKYVLLATSKTKTMEGELAQSVARGYHVVAATGAHKEMLVALEKIEPGEAKPEYRLLSTTRSATLEKEIVEASRDGYQLLSFTLCALVKSAGPLGSYGYEIAAILEKSPRMDARQYKTLATKRVSTLQKELQEAAAAGWSVNRLFLGYEEQIVMLERTGRNVPGV